MSVWARREPEDDQMYDRGTILDINEDTTVRVRIGPKEKMFKQSDLLMDDLDSLDPSLVTDVTRLSNCNEAAVAALLHRRYNDDNIYTYAWPALVAINPFRNIDKTGPADVLRYRDIRSRASEQPHIFQLAADAFDVYSKGGVNVSFVISGESGAGKTETAKLVMGYLSAGPDGKQLKGNPVQEAVLAGNPVLEAFGNAKTLRNNNSSRFGRFVKLYMNDGGISAGEISSFLLEKSRVTTPRANERNFHIFYQLLAGLTTEQLTAIGLVRDPKNYRFLASGTFTVEGKDDVAGWKETCEAFKVIGLSAELIQEIQKVLAAVLLIGQVTFVTSDKDSTTTPVETVLFARIANLLGVNSKHLEKAICVQTRHLPLGMIVDSPFTAAQATSNFESLGRAAYSRIFELLISKLNENIKPSDPEAPWVGILDIFGFEYYKSNSLEQFLINFANEKLQTFFTRKVFEQERRIYEKEGIDSSEVVFEDNSELCAVLQGTNNSILEHLESVCIMQTGTNESFLSTLLKAGYNPDYFAQFHRTLDAMHTFMINHSSAPVAYDVSEFREKNMDKLIQEVCDIMVTSTNVAIATAFQVVAADPGSPRGRLKGQFTASQFSNSMQSLMQILADSQPFFVRCVQPNVLKKPLTFQNRHVINQLHCLSVMEAINLARKGYGYRKPYEAFLREFSDLRYFGIPFSDSKEPKAAAADVIDAIVQRGEPLTKNDARFGLTMVFIKKDAQVVIDNFKRRLMDEMLPLSSGIKKVLASASAVQDYNWHVEHNVVGIQSHLRMYLNRKAKMLAEKHVNLFLFAAIVTSKVQSYLVVRKNALIVQATMRNFLKQLDYNKLRNHSRVVTSVALVSNYARTAQAVLLLQEEKKRQIEHHYCVKLQRSIRSFLRRRTFRAGWTWRMLVWPMKAQFARRSNAASIIRAAWVGYSVRRSTETLRVQMSMHDAKRKFQLTQAVPLLHAMAHAVVARRKFTKLEEAVSTMEHVLATRVASETYRRSRFAIIWLQKTWRGVRSRRSLAMYKIAVLLAADRAAIRAAHNTRIVPGMLRLNLRQLSRAASGNLATLLLSLKVSDLPKHAFIDKISAVLAASPIIHAAAATREYLYLLQQDKTRVSQVPIMSDGAPVTLPVLPKDAAQIEASEESLLVRTVDGKLFAWKSTFKQFEEFKPAGRNVPVLHAAARQARCAVVDSDGHVWLWGPSGQRNRVALADEATKVWLTDTGDYALLRTGVLARLDGGVSPALSSRMKIQKLSAGRGFTVALAGSTVFEWGRAGVVIPTRVQPKSNMVWVIEDAAATGDEVAVRLHGGDCFTWNSHCHYIEKVSNETLLDPALAVYSKASSVSSDFAVADAGWLSLTFAAVSPEEPDLHAIIKATESAAARMRDEHAWIVPKRTAQRQPSEIAVSSADSRVRIAPKVVATTSKVPIGLDTLLINYVSPGSK